MKLTRICRTVVLAAALLASGACVPLSVSPANPPSTLDPRGPAAAHLASLWWLMFVLGVAIWVLVMVLMFMGVFRKRRAGEQDAPDDLRGSDTGRRWPFFSVIM